MKAKTFIKASSTTLLLCVMSFVGFAQETDNYLGHWKQIDGNISMEITKDTGEYFTVVYMDSMWTRGPGLKNQLGLEVILPMEEQSINFAYDEKSKLLVGFWATKNKTIKLKKE